ncbi:MAG: hypothetical protein ACRD0Z_04365 [Acidimicrobiales bacterium]
MAGLLRRRPALEVSHRPGRKIVISVAVAVVVAVVVGEVAADVVNSGGPASALSNETYAAAVLPVIDESTALLPWLHDVRHDAVHLGRPGLESALGHLVAGTTDVQTQLSSLGISPPSAPVGRLLAAAFAARSAGAHEVTSGVTQAIGPEPDVTAAARTLAKAGTDLKQSDADYLAFVRRLPAYVRKAVKLPPSTWYQAADWAPSSLASYAGGLGSAAALRFSRSLVILAIAIDPPALRYTNLPTTTTSTTSTTTTSTTTTTTTFPGETTSTTRPTTTTTTTSTTTTTTTMQVPPPGSVSWLQPTSKLTVEVVVANAGDLDARHERLQATLRAVGQTPSSAKGTTTTAAPLPATQSVNTAIASLPASSSVDVSLPALKVMRPGRYVLTVVFAGEKETVTLQVA